MEREDSPSHVRAIRAAVAALIAFTGSLGASAASFIREVENGGVPESVEPLFVRIGGEYFKRLLENTWDQYVNTLTKD